MLKRSLSPSILVASTIFTALLNWNTLPLWSRLEVRGNTYCCALHCIRCTVYVRDPNVNANSETRGGKIGERLLWSHRTGWLRCGWMVSFLPVRCILLHFIVSCTKCSQSNSFLYNKSCGGSSESPTNNAFVHLSFHLVPKSRATSITITLPTR